MDIAADDLRQRCFLSLAVLGALYLAAVTLRLLDCLGLPSLLRRPTNLRRRYGAWAVVTGPTSGIGRSMALELARRGLSVVLIGRDPDRLCDISDAITRNHAVQTKTVVFDLSLVSTTQGDEAMRRLREAVEGLDVGVLVNNAGVAKPCAVYLHEFDVEAWMRMVRVNLWALTEVAAAVLPGMAARGRGAVVNIGSGSTEAIPSFPLYTVYAATKRYVAQFSRSLYVEYRSKGIDVQCQGKDLAHTTVVPNCLCTSHKSKRFIACTYSSPTSRLVPCLEFDQSEATGRLKFVQSHPMFSQDSYSSLETGVVPPSLSLG
ncbi:hypothetical protein PAHAL_4G221700 [Panicum hallii]|uniref:Uncharacterized protein n=1 Tax=Panicum hallii TaxID=206008 RepID=A0A2T8JDN6_9POAL|nr:hypothetical protein PAHAL_4G221700 [Panicum hallii]